MSSINTPTNFPLYRFLRALLNVTVRACKNAPAKFASLVGVREVQGCSEARAQMYTMSNDGQKIKLS